jgi:hypothetical protein
MRTLALSLLAGITLYGHADAACTIKCRNEGNCTAGPTRARDYCTCPTGYTGALCENKFLLCESNTSTCFHNDDPCERAVDDHGLLFFHCACDPEHSESIETSPVCQHAATSFCTVDTESDGKFVGAGGSYCANSGKCKEKNSTKTHHAGCLCTDAWTGPHCEKSTDPTYQKKKSPTTTTGTATPDTRQSSPIKRIITMVVSGVLLIGMIGYLGFFLMVSFGLRVNGPPSTNRRGKYRKVRRAPAPLREQDLDLGPEMESGLEMTSTPSTESSGGSRSQDIS